MRTTTTSSAGLVAIGIAALLTAMPTAACGQQTAAVQVGDTDLGGLVSEPNGPEAARREGCST
jgi:hypothetical protein